MNQWGIITGNPADGIVRVQQKEMMTEYLTGD